MVKLDSVSKKSFSIIGLHAVTFLIGVFAIATAASGQSVPTFTKTFGGTSGDEAIGVAVDSSRNVFITGSFQGTVNFNPAGSDSKTSNGLYDIFLTKYNNDGSYAWTKNFGGTGHDSGFKVKTDSSGNVYVVGYFSNTVNFNPSGASYNLSSQGSADIFVSKFSNSGAHIWTASAGSTYADLGHDVAVDASGNIFVVGEVSYDNLGDTDIFIIKLNSSGSTVWSYQLGGYSPDVAKRVAVDASGNVYMTGGFEGTVDFDGTPGTNTRTSSGSMDTFITKYNSNGTYGWTVTAGGNAGQDDEGFGIAVDTNGKIHVVATEVSTTSGKETSVVRYTSSGAFDGGLYIEYSGSGDENPYGLTVDANGNRYIVGQYHNGSTKGLDAYLTKVKSDHQILWTKPIGGTGTDIAWGVAVDSLGIVYVAGSYSGTVDFDLTSGTDNRTSNGSYDGFLMRYSKVYSIGGTVTSGSGLSGVTISAGGLGSTITSGTGSYSLQDIDYGTSYTITPSLTNYTFTPTSSSGTLTGNVTHNFTGVQISTTTTTVAATTTVPTSTVAFTTTVPTSTVAFTTTVPTSTVAFTTTVPTSTVATTTVSTDSDGDGLTDSQEQTLGTDPESADSDRDGITDGEEISTGTNPKDPGSKLPILFTTLCSEWNGYLGGMYNIMEHVNLTTKKLKVETNLRSITGQLKDTYEFSLRGNQQFDLLVHSMSGRELNSYGQVCSRYTGAPAGSLDGRMVYYRYGENGKIQFAFALPFENPVRGSSGLLFNTYQPSLNPNDAGNLITNWVQLTNASKKTLTGKLYFYSLAGKQLGSTISVTIKSGARNDYSAHTYGSNNAGLVRFVPKDNTQDYQLREVRYFYDNPSGEDSFSSALPLSSMVGSGETLIAPFDVFTPFSDLQSGKAGQAVLELANTLGQKVSVNIRVYDKMGAYLLYNKTLSLKAYDTEHLPIPSVSTGLVTVKGSHTGSIVGTVVHYGLKASDSKQLRGLDPRSRLQNIYAVDLREAVGKTFKGSYNTYLNQGCTLYLGNASSSSEKVRISMKQSDGSSPIKDYNLTVPGRGVIAEDVCSKSPANVYGVVTVTATKPNRIYGVVVRKGEGDRYRMATPLR